MPQEQSQAILIKQLEKLNENLEKQHTLGHFFMTGIMYGTGFFVGSAILATIALGVLGPVVGQIPWIKKSFDRGTSITHQTPQPISP